MELNLVQQVELKLLLADTDAKANAALGIFLVPLIQKLTSTNVEVGRKVVEVLHFVKQKKHNSNAIVFPLEKLMAMFEKSVLGPNYATPGIIRQNKQLLVFIGLEVANIDASQPLQITADRFVRGLRNADDFSQDVKDNAAEQFSLFLLALNRSSDPSQIDASSWDPLDVKVLQTKLAQLFLLDLRHFGLHNQPGKLSEADTEFFVNHGAKIGITLPLENDRGITLTRKNVLKFVTANSEVFKHVIVAAMGDPMLDISRQARSEAAKINGYDLNILQNWALTGSTNLRLEVVELMVRKKLVENLNLEIILSALTTTGNLRLRQSALQLLQEMFNSQSVERPNWPVEDKRRFYQALHQYIIDDGWPRSQVHSAIQTRLRQQCYELLGNFDTSQSTLTFLFQSLERDSPEMSASIQKSLTEILESTGGDHVDGQKLLEYMERSQNHRTRYAAVRFAVLKLAPTDPLQRLICLLGIDSHKNRSDVVLEAQRGLISFTSRDELPKFLDMLSIIEQAVHRRDLSSEQEVNYALLFLLSCLIQQPPLSIDWTAEMTAALSVPNSPLLSIESLSSIHELKAFVSFLFKFVLDSHAHYKLVPLLLERLLVYVPVEDFGGLVDIDSLTNILINDSSNYGSFVAEYLPLISPSTEIRGENELQVLAQAFRAAALNTPSKAVDDLALSTENLSAILVLAVSNMINYETIASNESLEAIIKQNQLAQASLTVNASIEARRKVLDDLLKFSSRSFDDLVANGEAITVAASGWQSRVLQEKYPTLSKKDHIHSPRSWELEEIALKAVTTGIRGSPESRRIACVRLLCLTQYSFYNIGDHPGIAAGIQSCFMSLLSDSDDVTQESAGRGLEILFESSHSDKSLQKELLSTLVSSFTDEASAKKFTAGTLTADTQVFEPGALPSEPQGGKKSISTYKDVMNLANETGDSSLVYKFMSLSANSRIWTGRKGMAFSLQQILAKSELAAQIFEGSDLGRKLIPNLFRYLYDPVEVTKTAMKNIWLALIPSSKRSTVIKLYLPEISSHVFKGVVDREWRVRQASTLALSDLVSQGLVGDSLEAWQAGFRSVDDIKDSVSTAGSELLHTLTNSMVRAFSAGKSPDLSEVLPFLIKGLNNKSTVKFSLETILKLSETKGFKPYAAQVVEELTVQLSSIEPQALNYLALNTSQQMVDEVRAQGLRMSPIMQGLESMVERGAPSTEELWSILPRIVKKSVGVSSKLAAARLIVLTSMMSYGDSRPATESLLNSCLAELWGNNDLVSEHFASALAYVCRRLPLPLVIKYAGSLREKYAQSESDDTRPRKVIATALLSLSDVATDVYSSISSTVLPLVFVGSCLESDDDEKGAKIFKKVWENNAGGEATLRLYRSELVEFCVDLLLNSTARILKIAAGNALERSILKGQRVSVQDAKSAMNALLGNLSGRSWPGKEHIFAGLVAVYPSIEDPDLRKTAEERVLNEIQRKNAEYKLAILPSVVRHLEDSEILTDDVIKHIREGTIEAAIEVCDDDEDAKVSACESVLRLGDARVYEHALAIDSWKYRVAACEAITESPFDPAIWTLVSNKCAGDEGHERVRLAWSRAAGKFKDHDIVIEYAKERHSKEPSPVVKQELRQVISNE